jgi:hypothetical protein
MVPSASSAGHQPGPLSRKEPRASGTVDRYAHGVTAMRGMAARHLTIQITARAARA